MLTTSRSRQNDVFIHPVFRREIFYAGSASFDIRFTQVLAAAPAASGTAQEREASRCGSQPWYAVRVSGSPHRAIATCHERYFTQEAERSTSGSPNFSRSARSFRNSPGEGSKSERIAAMVRGSSFGLNRCIKEISSEES